VVGRVGVLVEVVVEVGLEIAAPEVLLERLLVRDGERVDEDGAFAGEVLECRRSPPHRLHEIARSPRPARRTHRRAAVAYLPLCCPIVLIRFNPMKEGIMPFVEVFTREKLSDEIRAKLAEELSNTIMTVEVGGPTESAKMIDWMWFHTMPADSWAVGGRFDDTYVKGRKMPLARIIAPQGLMNTELKSRAVKEVARVLKAALGVGEGEDDTGIFTMCVEIDDGQWARRFPRSFNCSITSAVTSRSKGALK
jgi:phenylpyruvate tautomerase PptA (4-oxalocrotonate tautomerase family)